MQNLFLGVDIGMALVAFYLLARVLYDNRRDSRNAKSDLKRQGYAQVELDGMRIKMGTLAWGKRQLNYTCGSFSVNLSLARMPRPDAEGFEWRLFLLLPMGGRRPVSTGLFSQMVTGCVDRASKAKESLVSGTTVASAAAD